MNSLTLPSSSGFNRSEPPQLFATGSCYETKKSNSAIPEDDAWKALSLIAGLASAKADFPPISKKEPALDFDSSVNSPIPSDNDRMEDEDSEANKMKKEITLLREEVILLKKQLEEAQNSPKEIRFCYSIHIKLTHYSQESECLW
jgi:hypothetical protein